MVLNTHFIRLSDFTYIEEWKIENECLAKLYSQEHENNPMFQMNMSSKVLQTNVFDDKYIIHLDYDGLIKPAAINGEPLSSYAESHSTSTQECELCEKSETRYVFLAEKSFLSIKIFTNIYICQNCLDLYNPEELIRPEDRPEILVSRI